MTMNSQMLCPCTSNQLYINCCQPFHDGQLPDTALKLMRSRFCAYALCIPSYIMSTTHPKNIQFNKDTFAWSQKIAESYANTEFKKLDILSFKEKGLFATVTFTADLMKNQQDISFTEKSEFEKVNGKWLYLSGQLLTV